MASAPQARKHDAIAAGYTQPPRSFRTRMWLLLGSAIAVYLLLTAPMYVHGWLMESRVSRFERAAEAVLARPDGRDAVQQWLAEEGFVVRSGDDSVFAERQLTEGSLFWRPTSAQALITFKAGNAARNDWTVWPFPAAPVRASRLHRVVPTYAPLLVVASLITVIALVNRRDMRRRRGECPDCGYPIGTSDVCTECGRPVERPTKKHA